MASSEVGLGFALQPEGQEQDRRHDQGSAENDDKGGNVHGAPPVCVKQCYRYAVRLSKRGEDMRAAWLSVALLGVVGTANAAGFSSVTVEGQGARVVCHGAATRTLDAKGRFDQAVLSPDGHTAAFIRLVPSTDVPGPGGDWGKPGLAGSLWIGDCRTGHAREVLSGVPPKSDGDVGSPLFSLDGKTLYASAAYGGDTLIVERIDVATGRHAIAFYANLMGIVTSGPYRGDLLAAQHTSLDDGHGGSYGGYPTYVFRPDGTQVLTVPGSESWNAAQTRHSLRKRGWRVRWTPST